MENLYEKIFDDTYETILRALTDRSKKTTASQFEAELQSYYKYDDLNWTGRGDAKQSEIDATILAYETFISRINEENNNN